MEASFHPETAQLVEIFKQMGRVFDPNVTVEHQRTDTSAAIAMINGMVSFDFSGTKFELFIPSSNSALPDGVPVDVIRPSNIQSKNPPILIYFHGGGMVVGNRAMTDITCKMLATQAQCIVVNVEYRLYPDNPAVAPFDDGVSVANWVLQNKQLIGGGALSAVGVGGDSAGGRLAASVAHDTSGLSFQILVYPHVSALGERFASYEKFKDAPLLNMELVTWFENQIKLSGVHPRSNSLGRPASSFSRLPPALIVLAEIDPIIDDGLEYAKKLAKYNIAHDMVTIKGTCHGFYTMPGLYKECSQQAYDATVAFIRKYGEEGKIIKPKANSRVCAIM